MVQKYRTSKLSYTVQIGFASTWDVTWGSSRGVEIRRSARFSVKIRRSGHPGGKRRRVAVKILVQGLKTILIVLTGKIEM